ncbi:MAG: hypothetical protein CTY18_03390 [Methylomonas sp.]|nr:MAG: hypothetical protein CTY24_07135 [Methylobacter sp.]PPD36840.1 MAG: hypothetical protein CTY18_03390 [Methylomonas sp.]
MKKLMLLSALLLGACVTINIYFPAAAAEKAADEIIKDIQKTVPAKPVEPKAGLSPWQLAIYRGVDQALSLLIADAHAEQADLAIDSPQVRQVRASMESRFGALKPFYDAGVIGIQADGLLAVHNLSAAALSERNKVNQLVAAENADRQNLYQAIANANGHPEWAGQIKTTFAARWLENAQAGWWYQAAGGSWAQK